MLLPIGSPEPFGLAVIEAMACGTPVIAFPFGSTPELIEPGVNGALVESIEQAVAALEALPTLDRTLCRRSFERALHHGSHGPGYVGVYEALAKERISSSGGAALPKAGIPIAVPLPVAAEERPVPPPLAAEERQPLSSRPSRRRRVVARDREEGAPPRGRPDDSDLAARVGRPERPLSRKQGRSGLTLARWRTAGEVQSAPQQTPDHEPGRKCNRKADKRPLLDLARDVAYLLPACR